MPVFQMPVKSNRWTKIKTLNIPANSTSPYQFTMSEHKNYSELLFVMKAPSNTGNAATLQFGHGTYSSNTSVNTSWFFADYAAGSQDSIGEFIISTDAPVIPIVTASGSYIYVKPASVDLAPKDYTDFYISWSAGAGTIDIYGR